MQSCISEKAAEVRSREDVMSAGINFLLVAKAIYWCINVLKLYSTLGANVGEHPPHVRYGLFGGEKNGRFWHLQQYRNISI
jgi:hypothetical protein